MANLTNGFDLIKLSSVLTFENKTLKAMNMTSTFCSYIIEIMSSYYSIFSFALDAHRIGRKSSFTEKIIVKEEIISPACYEPAGSLMSK